MTAKKTISRIDATFSRETSDSLRTKVPNPRLRCAAQRRAIDRDALLDLADELEEPWPSDIFDTVEGLRGDFDEYARAVAWRIRKAVEA